MSLISQIIAVASPLIVTPFLARRLLADNIGIFSFTESVVFIFGIFALFGSQTHGQREIAYCRGDHKKELQTFAEIFLASGITVSLVLAGYVVFICLQNQYRLIYWILTLEFIAFHWDISWFYCGREDFKSLLYRNVLVKSLYVILVFALIRSEEDLPLYVLLRSGTLLLGGAALLLPVVCQCIREKIRVRRSAIPGHLKKMMPLFVPQIAIQIYTVLDKTMIGVITQSAYQNGCYEEAMKVIRILMSFVAVISGVLTPRIASLFAAGDEEEIRRKLSAGLRLVCLITLPMVIGIDMVASVFVPWFLGPGYDAATRLLRILGILLLVIGVSQITGSCLLAVRQEKCFTRNVCIGAAVNFLLNLWLIYMFLAQGAAYASVIAELIVTALMLYSCRKYLDFVGALRMFIPYLLCGAVMWGMLAVVKKYISCNGLGALLILAACGAATYGSGLLIIRDKMPMEALRVIRTRLRFRGQ